MVNRDEGRPRIKQKKQMGRQGSVQTAEPRNTGVSHGLNRREKKKREHQAVILKRKTKKIREKEKGKNRQRHCNDWRKNCRKAGRLQDSPKKDRCGKIRQAKEDTKERPV